MAIEEKNSLGAGIAHAAAAFAQTPLPYLVGMGVVLAATHWDGHIQSQKGCVEVQQLSGKYFKVDSCNAKVEEIIIKEQVGSVKKENSTEHAENSSKK